MSTSGVDRATCPPYADDRRPELVEANAYFTSIDDNSGGDEGWSDSATAVFLVLSFAAGGVATVAVLLGLRRWRGKGGEANAGLLMSSSSSSAPQKAKNSF